MILINHIKKIRKKTVIKKKFPSSSVSLSSLFDELTILEGNNLIHEKANICGARVGYGTYINGFTDLSNCLVGRFSSIGSNVRVISGTHPVDRVSSYPGFYNCSVFLPFGNSSTQFEEFLRCKNGFFCNIGNDVWIGYSVIIKGGINIGDGAIIGMGSVVTKDIPPYAIVAGNPAKIIRYRFNQETIKDLLKLQWWNFPIQEIKLNRDKFVDINVFLKKYKNNY